MANFLFSANNSEGQWVTDRVDSSTVEGAHYALQTRGYSDVIFHTDGFSEETDRMFAGDPESEPLVKSLPPELELEARRSGGLWSNLWFTWRLNRVFWLPLGFVNLLSLIQGRPFGWFDILGFALMVLFLLYFVWTVIPGIAYERLLNAGVWHRWRSVRAWSKRLRGMELFFGVQIPEFELDFRLACARAYEGDLGTALNLMRKYEDDESVRGLYHGRLASVYEAAGDYARMSEFQRIAVEKGTGGASELVEYALGFVRRHDDPVAAKRALEGLENKEISEVVRIFVSYCNGLIALAERSFGEAEDLFSRAVAETRAYAKQPLFKGLLNEINAYRCIALSQLNMRAKARALLKEVTPLLRARGSLELLDRCRTAVGPGARN